MRSTTLAEELVLLAYDDEGRRRVGGTELKLGLGGALLLELALAGRVEPAGRTIRVRDAAPIGDPAADEALARMAADKERKPQTWVEKLGKGARERTLAGLVADGVLTEERAKVLGIFPVTRYPAPHGGQPAVEKELRRRLRAALTSAGVVERRTAALCALIAAARMDRKVFADLPRADVKRRLKELGRDDWAASAVRRAIESAYAAATGAAG